MLLVRLFVDHLLPILLVAGAGYLAAALLRLDARGFASVAFNVFAPCLVFQVIVESTVPLGGLLSMAGFAAATMGLPALVALAIARWRGWPRPLAMAVVLSVFLPNVGNYGMSANLLAFGPDALTQASLYFAVASVLTYTAGILVASMGQAAWREASLGLLRVPTLWGVALAFLLRALGTPLPRPLDQAVALLAQACIPSFLVILGMQLRGATMRGPAAPLVTATTLRLAAGTAAGFLLAPVFGLEGAARQAGIFQSAMPSAVITTILATEYDTEPAFVTSVVLATTLLSPFVLTPLLALLR